MDRLRAFVCDDADTLIIIYPKRTSYLADDVKPDGMVTHGRVFFDASRRRNHPFFGPDRFKVNRQGNSVGARSGGLSMIASDCTLFDKDRDGEPTSSVARRDGQTLFSRGGSRSIAFA